MLKYILTLTLVALFSEAPEEKKKHLDINISTVSKLVIVNIKNL